MSARIPRRFKGGKRTVSKAAEEGACIVDAHGLNVACEIVFSLFNEGFGHCRNFRNRSIEPHRRVDVMGQQIAGHAATGNCDIKSPKSLAALRQIL